jgi:adenosylmethionine---8-amino-7-oxononanoate aminotransferase
MDRDAIVRLDKRHVWHPYTPMDEWIERGDPIVVARAKGAWLEEADGRRYIDGNSSWWVAALGHGHPRLLRVLAEQSQALVHCARSPPRVCRASSTPTTGRPRSRSR